MAYAYVASYAAPDGALTHNAEQFEVHSSIAAAERSLSDRYWHGARQGVHLTFADGSHKDLLWPGVPTGANLALWEMEAGQDPLEHAEWALGEGEPDVVIEVGPRGGIRRVR